MSTELAPRSWRLAPSRAWVASFRSTVRAAAFWLAVLLPLAYLPLVVGLPSWVADPPLVVAVVTGNLLALVVGHRHEPSLAAVARGN